MPYKDPNAIKEYQKKYREAHKEEKSNYNSQYWKENKARLIEENKNWHKKNPGAHAKYSKTSYYKNREEYLARCKRYYYRTLDKQRERKRKYLEENREMIVLKRKVYFSKNKHKYALNHRLKYSSNIQYRLSCRLRTRLWNALAGNFKAGSAVRDLGCSIGELRNYLKSKFIEGMSWENYGRGGWNIDHIIPLDSFDLTDREQFLRAFHYTNLQPLWEIDNFKKGNKLPKQKLP